VIKHRINVLWRGTEHLNPGQIPVMAFEVPLFALAKFIQRRWPGGLHIERAIWKMFVDYLEGSRWTNALVQAGIASSGTIDSFPKVLHLAELLTRWTTLALAKLQEDAIVQSAEEQNDAPQEARKQEMAIQSPTF